LDYELTPYYALADVKLSSISNGKGEEEVYTSMEGDGTAIVVMGVR